MVSYYANLILPPDSQWGLIVLMNAENSLDDITARLRMTSIANGVSSLLVGQHVPPPPSNTGMVLVYSLPLGVIILQVGGIIRSAVVLQHGRVPHGPFSPIWHIALALAPNLIWALFILIILPKLFAELPLLVIATAIPDIGYTLLVNGAVALLWGIVRTVWVYSVLRKSGAASPVLM